MTAVRVGVSGDLAHGVVFQLGGPISGQMNAAVSDGGDREISCLGLSVSAVAAIRRHAEAVYPEEACGGLLGRDNGTGLFRVLVALPVTNAQANERRRRYLISAAAVRSLERRAKDSGLEVVGYYHSHPDAPELPSATDWEHAWPWYVYLIVSVERGGSARYRAWRLAGDRRAFVPLEICSGFQVTD